ncbi:fibronectin type III domain-containing protein [Terriglobus sp. 2YAB30_2]|uniref:fibronectin type III domain-containing protein n=1 Tax=unclassified Terriglobus TaxID=2628988 RepID=UPI003F9EAE66
MPQNLASGASVEVHYQVRITNAGGRAAGWSKPVTVAGGDAPEQIQGLQASLGGTGLLLRWTPSATPFDEVRIERIEPDKAQPKKKTSLERKQAQQQQTVLAVPVTQGDPGGAVDATAEAGQRYVYRLERRRRLRLGTDEIWVAGAVTELDTGILRDTTPPAVPQSVEALSSESGISLSWQPGTEMDLAGYLVYRVDDSGELRLTAMPVTAPQFTDTTAIKGKQYRYRVAAVDRAGNESGKSEPVAEEMR